MELARMEQLGLVRQERAADGRRVVIHVVQLHPAWAPLRALVRTLAEPEDVLKMTLAGLPHIAAGFIFGSVARGDAHPDSDCDFMVITDALATAEEYRAVKTALAVRAGETGLALGRELSIVIYSMEQLRSRVDSGHGFISRVLLGAKRWVRGSARDIEARLQLPAGVIP
jgi:predicted nucleotidyltransferase